MLRREIRDGIQNVLQAIDASGIPLILQAHLTREKRADAEACLGSFAKYMRAIEGFGPVERKILEVLDLEILHDLKLWEILLQENERGPELHSVFSSVRFAVEHLPKIATLYAREDDRVLSKEEKKHSTRSIITAVVMEDRASSSPERLVLVLESISGLYDACADIHNEKGGDLAVISCDAGSDKSFDFLGLAKIVDCVKQVILSFWDKVVYFREDKTGKQLELIANSLPILDQIAGLKQAGKLEPEKAELLKRQVVESITKFARAGVTIPEVEQFTVYNPRQLMQPERKLLRAGGQVESAEKERGGKAKTREDMSELGDPEFQKFMEKMARKFLSKKSGERAAATDVDDSDADEPNRLG